MSTRTSHWRKIAIQLIAELRTNNYTYAQIGKILNLPEPTIRIVHNRWKKIYLKLG